MFFLSCSQVCQPSSTSSSSPKVLCLVSVLPCCETFFFKPFAYLTHSLASIRPYPQSPIGSIKNAASLWVSLSPALPSEAYAGPSCSSDSLCKSGSHGLCGPQASCVWHSSHHLVSSSSPVSLHGNRQTSSSERSKTRLLIENTCC